MIETPGKFVTFCERMISAPTTITDRFHITPTFVNVETIHKKALTFMIPTES